MDVDPAGLPGGPLDRAAQYVALLPRLQRENRAIETSLSRVGASHDSPVPGNVPHPVDQRNISGDASE